MDNIFRFFPATYPRYETGVFPLNSNIYAMSYIIPALDCSTGSQEGEVTD